MTRRRLLLSTLPLFGHALSMMGVVDALCRRGHEVFWLSLPWQQDDGYNKRRLAADRIAERFGATALHTTPVTLASPTSPTSPTSPADPRRAAIQHDLIDVVPHQVDEVRALLRAHAIEGVLQDPFLAQLQIACTLEQIPFVCRMQGLRAFRETEQVLWSDALWESLRPGFAEVYARYGLPLPSYVAGQLLSPRLNLVQLGPELLDELRVVRPPGVEAAGFPHLDPEARRRLDVEVLGATPRPDADLGDGPRVLVSFGTGGRNEAQERAVEALTALAEPLGLALLVCDPQQDSPVRHQGRAIHVRLAPLWDCMGRVDLLVSHGGWGTTAQALRVGLPQLIIPEGFDQHDNGRRMEQLGVAQMVGEAAEITADALRPRLEHLLGARSRARAQQVARIDARTDGAITAATGLERVVAEY